MLSVIIPFAGEYPQVLFTIRSVAEALRGIDFEIIAVDNYCEELIQQSRKPIEDLSRICSEQVISDKMGVNTIIDYHQKIKSVAYENKAGEAIEASARGNQWLKYIKYEEKLSHWQAKRVGVEESNGDVLLFLDAHVVPSNGTLIDMYKSYKNFDDECKINSDGKLCDMGTLHLPLTYKILEWRKLIYKLVVDKKYFYTYSFTTLKQQGLFEVPCMSTCGMMISRKIYNAIGGWPIGLGIYGGGENFMNYTLAVCGYKKYVYNINNAALYHHGEKRDYHWNYDDFIKNRMIAHYLFGGGELLWDYIDTVKGDIGALAAMASNVVIKHSAQRDKIKSIQKIDIEKWAEKWITKNT